MIKIKQILVWSVFLIAICFTSCTPKSKLLTIARQRQKDANTPAVIPKPERTISKNTSPKVIRKSGVKLTPPSPIEGKLIQTGGSVEVLASELAIDLNIQGSNVSQIMAIHKYIIRNWHYIHDPKKSKDTWRSAETTIALRHKGKFPGDCDDFAILMASLAKQIGLRSRMVGGYSGSQGHAFAEFLLPENEKRNPNLRNCDYRTDNDGVWVSMDWFTGQDHNKYIRDIRIIEEE
ncbi:transglutaminase-like domain-containing protein [Marinifilum fragile]|uniref:transglutaminase-like domain-containing protein n=1 Tax=Marinifilum fragile TaxID=570161 RepID=UPI002AA946DA|nr:transglutaminase-like domain-containing protein [Marinifilum fragile]